MIKGLIVAYAAQGVIGYQGQLPWHLPKDLNHFKKVTDGHAVIMGRGTFISIGKALPGRLNIVLTRNAAYKPPSGCYVVHDLPTAFSYAQVQQMKKAFVIGGAQVYQAALAYVEVLYVTRVHATVPGDTFFRWKPDLWQEVTREEHLPDARHPYAYDFVTYKRKKGTVFEGLF